MVEICEICDKPLENLRQVEIGLCKRCEVEMHGCSTGDCPHRVASDCAQTLENLRQEQAEGKSA